MAKLFPMMDRRSCCIELQQPKLFVRSLYLNFVSFRLLYFSGSGLLIQFLNSVFVLIRLSKFVLIRFLNSFSFVFRLSSMKFVLLLYLDASELFGSEVDFRPNFS